MRLHRLRLRHFRGVGRCEVVFPDQGVVIVEGPNEVGKTSLAEALDLLLRYPDSSADRAVRAVQPVHRDAGPEVEAELSLGATRLRYRKRWLRQPETEVQVLAPEPRSLTGREAHDHARALLDHTLDDGLWRALRLAQGAALAQAALGSSQPLLRALDRASAGALGGPDEMGLLERARAERELYLTRAQGRPTQEHQAAQQRLVAAERREREAREAVGAVRRELDRHEEVSGELARVRAHLADQEPRVRDLEAQVAECDRLRRRRSDLESGRLALDAEHRLAQAAAGTRAAQVARLAGAGQELADTRSRLEAATQASAALRAQMAPLEARRVELAAEVDRARSAARVAEDDRSLLHGAAQAAELADRARAVADVEAQLRAALDTRDRSAIDPGDVRRLDTLREELLRAEGRAQREAGRLRLEALDTVDVALPGGPRRLQAGESVDLAVDATTTVEVPRLLRLTATSGVQAAGRARDVDARRAALAAACREAGVEDPAAAAARLRDHERAAAEADRVRSRLSLLLGERTPDLLRRQVEDHEAGLRRYREERPAAAGPLPEDLAAAGARLEAARAALDGAAAAAAATDAEVGEVRTRHARHEGERAQLDASAAVLEASSAAATAALESARALASDAALDAQVADRATALQAITLALADVTREVVAIEGLGVDAQLANALAVRSSDRDRLAALESERVGLEASIRGQGSEGPADRLTTAEADLEASRRAYDAVHRRAAAAALLHQTLERHREAARVRYQEPFRREVEALAQVVFGDAVTIGLDDDLRVTHRTLDGSTVPYESLSGGAREQLALCALLACARLVDPDDGVPVLIDDALGYSDPTRLERLGAVLAQAGRRSQVVILTCMPDRYRNVGGATWIRLDPAPPERPGGPAADGASTDAEGGRAAVPSVAGVGDGTNADAAILSVLGAAGESLGRAEIVARAGLDATGWSGSITRLLASGLVLRTGERRGARYRCARAAAERS